MLSRQGTDVSARALPHAMLRGCYDSVSGVGTGSPSGGEGAPGEPGNVPVPSVGACPGAVGKHVGARGLIGLGWHPVAIPVASNRMA